MSNSFLRSQTIGIAASILLCNSPGRQSSRQLGNSTGRELSKCSFQLLSKAREGDVSAVELLLGQPPEALVDINARGEAQMAALHLAAESNHEKVLARLLIEKSVDMNAQDDLGRTALFIAAQKGLPRVARILLEAGADVLIPSKGGYTALHVAAWHGHVEAVHLLLGISEPGELRNGGFAFPAEKIKKPEEKCSHFWSSKGSLSPQEMKRRLFRTWPASASGPHPGTQRKPKQHQSRGKSCNASSVSEDSRHPRPATEIRSRNVALRKLLESKTSAELFTALHLAARNGHRQVVESLIQAYGQEVAITEVLEGVRERGGEEGLNAVRTAISQILNSHADMSFDEDVESGALDKALGNIFFPGSEHSPIPWSAVDDMVSFVNRKDCIGRTPLHYAIWEQHAGVVEQLLELCIVNVNATDMDGFTPLHLGARKGSETAVELLLTHDSRFQTLNPNLRARQNKATWAKIVEIKRLQHKLGTTSVAINLQDVFFSEERDGITALHYAVEEHHEAVVAALTSHGNIDVFAMASPATKPEALATENGNDSHVSPLAMAVSSNDGNALLKLLKSGKRNRIMEELQSLRGYVSKPSKFEDNRQAVKEYHKELLKTTVRLVKLDWKVMESDMFSNLERELAVALNTLLLKPSSNKYSLLHHAAFAGLSAELQILLSIPDVAKDINAVDVDNQTALHFAVMEEEIASVKVLITDKSLNPNEEDRHNRTPLHVASEKRSRETVRLLMACPDVNLAVKKLYRERAVNDNAANAILVVAALIASVTFAGWLQPPLGLVNYSGLNTRHDVNSTVSVSLNYAALALPSVRLFWVFNTISFYFAMATVISGAAEVLPLTDAFIGQEVRMVRGGLVRTAILLVLSIAGVLGAFASAAFACLPPIHDYIQLEIWTTVGGWSVCISMLFTFWFRITSMLVSRSGHHQVKWLRFREENIVGLPGAKFLWILFKIFDFIPQNYTRFQSSRQDDDTKTFKRRVFYFLVRLFRLDREEYWRNVRP